MVLNANTQSVAECSLGYIYVLTKNLPVNVRIVVNICHIWPSRLYGDLGVDYCGGGEDQNDYALVWAVAMILVEAPYINKELFF
jgi:hypothetical protein